MKQRIALAKKEELLVAFIQVALRVAVLIRNLVWLVPDAIGAIERKVKSESLSHRRHWFVCPRTEPKDTKAIVFEDSEKLWKESLHETLRVLLRIVEPLVIFLTLIT